MHHQLQTSHFWNVNLPHPLDKNMNLDFEYCSLDTNPHQYNFKVEGNDYIYQGSIHERPRLLNWKIKASKLHNIFKDSGVSRLFIYDDE